MTTATRLDTSTMTVHYNGHLGWCYVDHTQRLATSSFTTEEALYRCKHRFADTPASRASMMRRYARMFPA